MAIVLNESASRSTALLSICTYDSSEALKARCDVVPTAADCSTEVQEADDYIHGEGGGKLVFISDNSAIFYFKNINKRAATHWEGAGRHYAKLYLPAGCAVGDALIVVDWENETVPQGCCAIVNLHLNGNKANQTLACDIIRLDYIKWGFHVQNCYLQSAKRDAFRALATNLSTAAIRFFLCTFSQNDGYAIYSTGALYGMGVESCALNSSDGVHIENIATFSILHGGSCGAAASIKESQYDGLYLKDCEDVKIIGISIKDSSQDTANTYSGIKLEDCSHVIIQGSHIWDTASATASKYQKYGIEVVGTLDTSIITMNDLTENITAGLFVDDALLTNCIVTPNLG